MGWREVALAVVALPALAFALYIAGRALAGGVARSWFEAKQRHEKQHDKQREADGGKHADPD